VIALPPSPVGAENATRILPFPAATEGALGASGTVDGTAGSDPTDGALVPSAFDAVTVHIYV
jgi:hypothetical protein